MSKPTFEDIYASSRAAAAAAESAEKLSVVCEELGNVSVRDGARLTLKHGAHYLLLRVEQIARDVARFAQHIEEEANR